MISFILRIMATEFIKRNYTHVRNGVKNSYKYIYNRCYTKKLEKNYTIPVPLSRSRASSF
jgi:hypothetical protein